MITYFGIVAGTHNEYIRCLGEIAKDSKSYSIKYNDISEIDGIRYFYVLSIDSLRGRNNYNLIYYGTYLNKPSILEIIAEYDIEQMRQTCSL